MKRKGYIRRRSNKPRRQLEAKLDKLWQTHVKSRAAGKCEKCGGSWQAAGHHMIKRAHKWHRHEAQNGVYLCGRCHAWAEESPDACREWLKNHDKERYEYHMLRRHERSRGPVPISTLENWRAMYETLAAMPDSAISMDENQTDRSARG